MEIIGSNSHHPRDMNLGMSSTARSRGEADIGLLVACKVQLSSEVIKWKTENLRLTKELDSAVHQTDNLKETVSKLIDRTKELEELLNRAEDENLHLKHRNAAKDEEKAAIVQRISMGFDKYHSFPCSELPKSLRLSRESWKMQQKISDPPVEDYIQVSHTLIDRMKQEIQEFREMSSQYRVKDEVEQPSASDTSTTKVQLLCEEPCDAELEETVSDLISETKSIKQCLFDQRRKLHRLMQSVTLDEPSEVNLIDNQEIQRSPSHSVKAATCKSNENSEYKGLEKYSVTTSNLSKSYQRKEVAPSTSIGEVSQLQSSISESPQNSNTSQFHHERISEMTRIPDHRICPICEGSFNDKTQKEFEEHVVNHLERESASLLDQYVVI